MAIIFDDVHHIAGLRLANELIGYQLAYENVAAIQARLALTSLYGSGR